MYFAPDIVDNSKGNTLLNLLKETMQARRGTDLDIATAFFDIKAYSLVKDEIQGMKNIRFLFGKIDLNNDKTLGDYLLECVKEEVEGFELTHEKKDTVKYFIEFLKKPSVQVRLYEKQFLHGKAYIFDKLAVIGFLKFYSSWNYL